MRVLPLAHTSTYPRTRERSPSHMRMLPLAHVNAPPRTRECSPSHTRVCITCERDVALNLYRMLVYVTGFEITHLPRKQQQDALFSITQ